MLTDLAREEDLLIDLVDDDLQMEGYLFDDTFVKFGEVVDALVAMHEEVSHGVLVVSLDAFGHFLSETRIAHRNHEVIFDL